MVPLRPFFPLTKSFFGLSYEYKKGLLDEIFICTQQLKNFTREDVLAMPTFERRYYLSLLKGKIEDQQENTQNGESVKYTGDGKRVRTVSGLSLVNKLRTGEIPNT